MSFHLPFEEEKYTKGKKKPLLGNYLEGTFFSIHLDS